MRNPQRRTALLDAAIRVLAREGARGLTFRRVDDEAGVPPGTASNYFARRAELLEQVGQRVLDRVQPDPERVEAALSGPPTRALDVQLLRELTERVTADRSGFLALLELRLEASRRPELQATLTATMRRQLEANVAFHLDAGFPGDRSTVLVLHLAMTGLLFEHLTLPAVLGDRGLDELTTMVVEAVVPPG
jgi:DNA-binding transcriptional regulator YbjK